MHLHCHDFFILGQQASSTFDKEVHFQTLNFTRPPRRDVALVAYAGWMVITFYLDNPGAWLFHCHIGVHVDEGLAVQFLETANQINLPNHSWDRTCDN